MVTRDPVSRKMVLFIVLLNMVLLPALDSVLQKNKRISASSSTDEVFTSTMLSQSQVRD